MAIRFGSFLVLVGAKGMGGKFRESEIQLPGLSARVSRVNMARLLQLLQSMQETICSSLQFLQRTDALASVLKCYLRDLPAKIGISERAMFGYRAGKYPVTAKALRKLQAAESAAGISPLANHGPTLAVAQDEFSSVVREDTTPYGGRPTPQADLVAAASKMAEDYHRIVWELRDLRLRLTDLEDLVKNQPPRQ